jgi:hypothetical protein
MEKFKGFHHFSKIKDEKESEKGVSPTNQTRSDCYSIFSRNYNDSTNSYSGTASNLLLRVRRISN